EIGRLLDQLEGFESSMPYESDEASLVRVTRTDWEKARRVPSELRAELTRQASLALPVWIDARERSDFKSFLPALRTNLDLRRRDQRHPDHDALHPGQPRGPLRDDARDRPRALRARRRPRARAHAARTRRLARPARVAEPAVGEPRRPQPSVLALLLPEPEGDVPGGARGDGARGLLPARQHSAAVPHPRRG